MYSADETEQPWSMLVISPKHWSDKSAVNSQKAVPAYITLQVNRLHIM